MTETREQRRDRLRAEAERYKTEMVVQTAEELRRLEAWQSDRSPGRPPIFIPYSVGWDRYA